MKKLLYLLILLPSVALADQVRTQVIIEDKVNGVDFRDAVYYKDEMEYELSVLDGVHDTERQARIDNFRNILENPPEPIEITKEMLEAEKADLEVRIIELDKQIAEKEK